MTERALPDPQSLNTALPVDGEVLSLNPTQTEIFQEALYDEETKNLIYRDSYEIWPVLDIRMSDETIDKLVSNEWVPVKVFRDTHNQDRPLAAIRWMMLQTHVTVDASGELQNLTLYREKLKNKEEGKVPSERQKKSHQPSQHELAKIARSDNGEQMIKGAVAQLEDARAEDLDTMLDYLMEVEDRVAPRVANINLVRLFNAIDNKMGGKDRDMIIAKRILLVMLDNELKQNRYEA